MSTLKSAHHAHAQPHSLLGFRLGAQRYALPIEPIAQIIEMVSITPIAPCDPCVEGVINVRGEVVPVMHLGCRLGLPKSRLQLHTPIVLLHAGPYQVGLIVDEALSVFQLARSQMRRISSSTPQMKEMNLIRREVEDDAGTLLVLNVQRLLTELVPIVSRVVLHTQQLLSLSDGVEACAP